MSASKIIIDCILLILCFSGCKNRALYENISVLPLTKNIEMMRAYDVPVGIFRGAVQPLNGNSVFVIWNIEGKREHWYHVNSPKGFCGTEKIVTNNWDVLLETEKDASLIYCAKAKNKELNIKFQLPLKKRPHTFYVLQNQEGKQLIVFADLSEEIVDEGLFGYLVISPD